MKLSEFEGKPGEVAAYAAGNRLLMLTTETSFLNARLFPPAAAKV
jgi:hypothetical protein